MKHLCARRSSVPLHICRSVAVAYLGLFFFAGVGACSQSYADEYTLERVDQRRVVISWKSDHAVDVYEGNDPDGVVGTYRLVEAGDLDGSILVSSNRTVRNYFILRDRITGKLRRIGERVLPLSRGSNFRDLGGYETEDGRHVKWGKIFRSAAMPLLSSGDMSYLSKLEVRSVVDLRSKEERELSPTPRLANGVDYIASEYPIDTLLSGISRTRHLDGGYSAILAILSPTIRIVFERMLTGNEPIVVHCTGGQDRTGIASALILSALGVPRQTIVHDYELSTLYRRPRNETPELDLAQHATNRAVLLLSRAREAKPNLLFDESGRPPIAELLDEIGKRWGSVDNYLNRELGVDPIKIAKLRSIYLE